MGDVSAEPSMEDILSSIKRIIAEDGDDRPARPRRASMRAVPPPATDEEPEEVLELSDPMPPAPSPTPRAAASAPTPTPAPAATAAPISGAPEPVADIVSEETAQATRGALDTLSRLLVKPAPSSDGTLEGLVREMLRPMLRDWLDANLPAMVESLVAREIAKITRGG
jgi:cell pole-organizing protein PopZ